MTDPTSRTDRCADCLAPERREFLRRSTLAVAGIALGLGLTPGEAAAWPMRLVSALRTDPDHVRYPMPAADGVQIDKTNEIIVVRYKGSVYAFNLACPHRNVALNWIQDEGIFRCPKHHSQYTPDGTFISGRATRGMDRFAVSKDGGQLVVDVTKMYKQDEDPAGWNAAKLAA